MITFSLHCSYFCLSTFSDPLSWRSFLPLYSYINCILALHLDSRWSLLGYLSHHCLAGGDKIGCRLWGHCLRAKSRKKEGFLYKFLPWASRGATILLFILLSFTMITFSLYCSYFCLSTFSDPPSWRSFIPLYSYIDCILALHLDSRWSLLGYLSHHCLVGGDKVGCKLWGHYLGGYSAIKCGCDGCFIWKLAPSLACMSLLPSSTFNHMALHVSTSLNGLS